jgi:hypothetical protein
MPTSFPGTVDTYTTKVDNVSDVLAADINNLQDAVVAIQNRVGLTASGAVVTAATAQTISGNKTFTGTTFLNGVQRATDLFIGQSQTLLYENVQNALAIRTGAAGSHVFTTIDTAGNFASPGGVTAAGNVTANSDERLKHNWRDLDADFLTRLAMLKMGVYDRTDTGQTQVGVSAQSLQSFLPQAVQAGDDGILSVAYGNAALVAAVELAREVVSLRRELNEMKGA